MSWQSYFDALRLTRGYGYYQQQRVDLTHCGKHRITAKVRGTRTYHVQIRRHQGSIRSAFCDCPDASRSPYCKHLAATLYAADARHSWQSTDSAATLAAIETAPDWLRQHYLANALARDPQLARQFTTTVQLLDEQAERHIIY